jgi:hypothetical protein
VKGPIIEQKDVKSAWIDGGKVIEEKLKGVRIQGRQFEEEALAGQGFDRPIQVETLKTVPGGP